MEALTPQAECDPQLLAYTPPRCPRPLVTLDGVSVRRSGALLLRGISSCGSNRAKRSGCSGSNGSGKDHSAADSGDAVAAASSGTGTVLGARLASLEVETNFLSRSVSSPTNLPSLFTPPMPRTFAFVAASVCLARQPTRRYPTSAWLAYVAAAGDAVAPTGCGAVSNFARMLLIAPRLLLLDEAHVGLDPDASKLVAHVTAGGNRTGRSRGAGFSRERAGDFDHPSRRRDPTARSSRRHRDPPHRHPFRAHLRD